MNRVVVSHERVSKQHSWRLEQVVWIRSQQEIAEIISCFIDLNHIMARNHLIVVFIELEGDIREIVF